MNRPVLNKVVLFLVVFLISILFISMIRQFLMVILVTGIFSAMTQPIYRRFLRWFKGRKNLSAAGTLLFVLLIIFLPLAGLFGIVAGQAVKISQTVKPWIEQRIQAPSAFGDMLQALPFYEFIEVYRNEIFEKAGALVGKMSAVLFDSIQSVTLSTVNFLFLFIVFLYTMFFFLKEGDFILNRILYYLPLTDADERRMLERFTSVSRATLKGTLMIGVIQGDAGGARLLGRGDKKRTVLGHHHDRAFHYSRCGFGPGLGSGGIHSGGVRGICQGGGLADFCGVLVGSVDNILRPRFVGKDTQMHELMIFFGTLGGISLFGIIGFIIGPIVAALFVTVWDIYGETFKEYLPEVGAPTTGVLSHLENSSTDIPAKENDPVP